MRFATQYFQTVHNLLDQILATQQEPMMKAVEAMATSAAKGGVIHIFGCGHTQLLDLEIWYRAGQPACISPMLDAGLWPHNGPLKGSAIEKLPGYAELIFKNHDAQPGEVIIVISNSGRNAAPLEVALAAKEKGLTVVGITSMDYSTRVTSKHKSGKRLFEVADITIDNAAPMGDATMNVPGVGPKVGPVTTILNAAILDAMLVEMDVRMAEMSVKPPVFTSANLDVDLSANEEYVRRYSTRVKYYKG